MRVVQAPRLGDLLDRWRHVATDTLQVRLVFTDGGLPCFVSLIGLLFVFGTEATV